MIKVITYSFILFLFTILFYHNSYSQIKKDNKKLTYDNIISQQKKEKIDFKNYTKNQVPKESEKELQFLAFYINQAVMSNFHPESSLFNGQLVGRLFGQNGSNTSSKDKSYYVEQRLLPFFIYKPKLFNGKAILRASFEIDWTWGDNAYVNSGNKGSAISADAVNLQTQNIELELIPAKGWAINLGLQRLYDTPYNPYRTFVDKLLTTGNRLAYWGTDGVGISIRKDWDFSKLKTGFYKLYENSTQLDDDVSLFEIMYENSITNNWKLGVNGNYVKDRSKGAGGPSTFGQGLTSLLPEYSGLFKFNLGAKDYKADIFWLGTNFSYNADLMNSRWFASGFLNYNFGTVTALGTTNNWGKETDIDVSGLGANLRAGYRYGQTTKDIVNFDFMYTTGDGNALEDKKYSGVVTGNYWGYPGAAFIGTGSYLIFPHSNVVNRFTPAVGDISNMGYGLTAATINLSRDIIPNKVNAKLGYAYARSVKKTENGGQDMGSELNFSLSYNFGPFMSLEFHAAKMWLGNFYDSNDDKNGFDVNGAYNTNRPEDPYTAFLVFKWLMF